MTKPLEPPYLSIVFTGRNDDFGGDFTGRFFRALEFNHLRLREAGISHEFIFVEWRPIAGKRYLASELAAVFPDLAQSYIVSYVIDPTYHDAFSLNPRLQFQEFIAKNAGIRRARGQFVLTSNTDIYLGRRVMAILGERRLKPGVLYRATRVDIRDGCDHLCVDWSVLEDPRNVDVENRISPPWYTNASGDFLLLDRESCHRIRGFNEVYRRAKIHLDSNFCVKAWSAGFPIVDLHAEVYHYGRGTLNAQAPAYRRNPGAAPWGDITWNSTVVYENPENWGLGDAPLVALAAHTRFLRFDWRAVPPLVDLHRVRPPRAVTS